MAVPDAPPDYLAEDEVALIGAGLDYLREVWSSTSWRLYEVEDSVAIGAEVTAPDSFEVEGEGRHEVDIEFSNYFEVVDGEGRISEGEEGMTVVDAASDRVTVESRFP